MTTTPAGTDLYYDPYDFDIDADPYPVWKRLRDEAPLYYNEQHDFYALSRFDDVRRGLADWKTYISGKGSVLELIKSGMEIPPGSILFEDPPAHDEHREPPEPGLHAQGDDRHRARGPSLLRPDARPPRRHRALRLHPRPGRRDADAGRSACCWASPRRTRRRSGTASTTFAAARGRERAQAVPEEGLGAVGGDGFAEYIEWRAEHPSDDLMTKLLNAEFEDTTGTTRKLTREEVLGYVGLLAGAGNETTTRLIGWAGKLLAEHPDQRQELVDDPSLIPGAIEELLRYEAPSPVQARLVTQDVEHHGRTVPAGSVLLLMNGAANRDERTFPDPDRFDIHRKFDQHLSFGYGIHFCLGSHLARLEGRIALDEVLQRFPTWEVDWDHAVQAHTSTVRGWESLPVTVP